MCLPDGASIASGGSGGASSGGASGGAVDPATCANTYEIVVGDYWVRIADASGTELADLLEANGATNDTMLFPGKTICLPAGAAPPSTAAPSTAAPTTAAPTTDAAGDEFADDRNAGDRPAATDPPTTEAPDTTQPLPPPPSGGEVEAMIREIWPDDLEEQALRIAWRESNYRADVTSGSGCCIGIFQMHWEAHRSWMSDLGITSATSSSTPAPTSRPPTSSTSATAGPPGSRRPGDRRIRRITDASRDSTVAWASSVSSRGLRDGPTGSAAGRT